MALAVGATLLLLLLPWLPPQRRREAARIPRCSVHPDNRIVPVRGRRDHARRRTARGHRPALRLPQRRLRRVQGHARCTASVDYGAYQESALSDAERARRHGRVLCLRASRSATSRSSTSRRARAAGPVQVHEARVVRDGPARHDVMLRAPRSRRRRAHRCTTPGQYINIVLDDGADAQLLVRHCAAAKHELIELHIRLHPRRALHHSRVHADEGRRPRRASRGRSGVLLPARGQRPSRSSSSPAPPASRRSRACSSTPSHAACSGRWCSTGACAAARTCTCAELARALGARTPELQFRAGALGPAARGPLDRAHRPRARGDPRRFPDLAGLPASTPAARCRWSRRRIRRSRRTGCRGRLLLRRLQARAAHPAGRRGRAPGGHAHEPVRALRPRQRSTARFAGDRLLLDLAAVHALSPPGQALLRLSFSHAAQRKSPCRERSAEELAKLPPNMRGRQDCPRERAPVIVELELDGVCRRRHRRRPRGCRATAPRCYRRFAVPAGTHRLAARLADNATGELRPRREEDGRPRAGPRAGDRLRARQGRDRPARVNAGSRRSTRMTIEHHPRSHLPAPGRAALRRRAVEARVRPRLRRSDESVAPPRRARVSISSGCCASGIYSTSSSTPASPAPNASSD